MAEQLQNMFHLVEQEMEAYNRTFESYMMTDNPLLHSILTNMSEHRGKGMRPLITILSAKLLVTSRKSHIIWLLLTSFSITLH